MKRAIFGYNGTVKPDFMDAEVRAQLWELNVPISKHSEPRFIAVTNSKALFFQNKEDIEDVGRTYNPAFIAWLKEERSEWFI